MPDVYQCGLTSASLVVVHVCADWWGPQNDDDDLLEARYSLDDHAPLALGDVTIHHGRWRVPAEEGLKDFEGSWCGWSLETSFFS